MQPDPESPAPEPPSDDPMPNPRETDELCEKFDRWVRSVRFVVSEPLDVGR